MTNTTKESKNILHQRLKKLGFDIKEEEIFSSLCAAKETIIKRKLNPLLLLDSAAMEEFQDLAKPGELDAVVIGLAPEKFNYDNLNRAFRCVNYTYIHLKQICPLGGHILIGRKFERAYGA